MVEIIFFNIKPSSMLLENILSISVFWCVVTRVRVVMQGRKKFAYIESKNAVLAAFASYFSKSIFNYIVTR